MTKIIRYILTIILLTVVWFHAHWSVALCLSLIFIATEMQNDVYDQLRRVLKVHNLF
jgi:hypothetical protein